MKKQQLYTRFGPDVAERVIRRFNEREMSLQDAVDALGVGKTQVYNLRTQWLAAGKNASFPGASGGDRKQAWPEAAVEDLCSRFGRMCRALGMNHRIAPTPQAKGKIERPMRTFQHRIVVVLKAEGVDSEIRANVVAREHIDLWCRTHVNDETGEIPDERMQRLVAGGKTRIRAAPNEKVLRLFLSRHIPRSVELGCRVEFVGRKWRIARTLKKTVWLAIRPENAGFYVLETRPDPTNPVVPRILAKYRF